MSREGKVLDLVGMVRRYPIDTMMEVGTDREKREQAARMMQRIRERKEHQYWLDETALEIGSDLYRLIYE